MKSKFPLKIKKKSLKNAGTERALRRYELCYFHSSEFQDIGLLGIRAVKFRILAYV
jgi:hypothetical protein